MSGRSIPRALAERLGVDGTEALASVLESAQAEWSDAVLTLAAERFERTLLGEISSLRLDMAGEFSKLRVDVASEISKSRVDVGDEIAKARVDVADEIAKVRVDVAAEISKVRVEVAGGLAMLRTDLVEEVAAVRQEVGTWRVELFKWSFLFWIGQVAVIAGLLAFMLGSDR